MPRCCQTFRFILLVDVLLVLSLPIALLFLGPYAFQMIVLALLLGVPLLALRDVGNSVGWLAQTGGHNAGAALARLACGGGFVFLVCSSLLEAFQGQKGVGLALGLFLLWCVIQQFRLVGGMAVNLLLCLGAPLYCRSRSDWKWTLGCLALSLAGIWVMKRPHPQPELFGPALAGALDQLFSMEYVVIVLWCLGSFAYGLMWGGTLQYFVQKSFSRSR